MWHSASTAGAWYPLGEKETVKVWDATETPAFLTLKGPADGSSAPALAYSHDGRQIAIRDTQGQIGVYDALSGELAFQLPLPKGERKLLDVEYGPDGRRIAARRFEWFALRMGIDRDRC